MANNICGLGLVDFGKVRGDVAIVGYIGGGSPLDAELLAALCSIGWRSAPITLIADRTHAQTEGFVRYYVAPRPGSRIVDLEWVRNHLIRVTDEQWDLGNGFLISDLTSAEDADIIEAIGYGKDALEIQAVATEQPTQPSRFSDSGIARFLAGLLVGLAIGFGCFWSAA